MHAADRAILDYFSQVRTTTMELIRRIPEDWLRRTPEGGRYALSVLLHHAVAGEAWWMHAVLRDGGPSEPSCEGTRRGLLGAAEAARQRVVGFFEGDDGRPMERTFAWTDEEGQQHAWTGRDRVLYFMGHEIHHRGRVVQVLQEWGFQDIPFMPVETGQKDQEDE